MGPIYQIPHQTTLIVRSVFSVNCQHNGGGFLQKKKRMVVVFYLGSTIMMGFCNLLGRLRIVQHIVVCIVISFQVPPRTAAIETTWHAAAHCRGTVTPNVNHHGLLYRWAESKSASCQHLSPSPGVALVDVWFCSELSPAWGDGTSSMSCHWKFLCLWTDFLCSTKSLLHEHSAALWASQCPQSLYYLSAGEFILICVMTSLLNVDR